MRYSISEIVVLCGVVAFSLIAGSSQAFEANRYFPLTEGNKWVYVIEKDEKISTQISEVVGREEVKGIQTYKVLTGKEYAYLDVSTNGIKQYKQLLQVEKDYTVYDPPCMILPAFKNVGESLDADYVYIRYSPEGDEKKRVTRQEKIIFEAIEDIEVMGRDFNNCIKISYTGFWKDDKGSYGTFSEFRWYAEGVGPVKNIKSATEYDENRTTKTVLIKGELKAALIDGTKIGEINAVE